MIIYNYLWLFFIIKWSFYYNILVLFVIIDNYLWLFVIIFMI